MSRSEFPQKVSSKPGFISLDENQGKSVFFEKASLSSLTYDGTMREKINKRGSDHPMVENSKKQKNVLMRTF